MGSLDEDIAAVEADNAAALAEAEREAEKAGKDPFSLEPLRALYSSATLASRERALRGMYYVGNPEMRTMGELVALLGQMELYE
jgi:hypothetical protein